MYKNNNEFLKYDCFGKTQGHYHTTKTKDRIYFIEQTVEEQINFACTELLKVNVPQDKIDMVKELMIVYENNFYKHLRNTLPLESAKGEFIAK